MLRILALCFVLCAAAFPVLAGEIPPVPPRKPPVPAQVVLARPIAGPVAVSYAKGEAIIDVEGLKIVNTGELNAEGRVLLAYGYWHGSPKGALEYIAYTSPAILGQLNILITHKGRIFYLVVHERGDDGSVEASYTSRGPENYKTLKAKLAAKASSKKATRP